VDTAKANFAPTALTGWLDWLRSELAPFPERKVTTARIVVAVALVVVISMTLQIPEASLSAYMVLFVTKENKVTTILAGVLFIVGATVAIATSLLVYRFTFDWPELRVPSIALILFLGFFLSRVFALGPLAFAIGFIFSATQSVAELAPSAEYLVRGLLWLWVAVTYPIALTLVITRCLPQTPKAPGPAHKKKPLIAEDAFTNPAHWQFAVKVTLAAMTCYLLYTAVDWAGIHTAFITCCFISLETTKATRHKGALRLAGCMVGGLLGFVSILYLIPQMTSIASLALLVTAVTLLAGWVAAGSERIAYAGLQIGLAYYICILQGFAPDTDLEGIRDRFVGIVFGIVVTMLVFRYIWPEREPDGSIAN
jgi:uncharacterized membrane protein YccC